MKMYKYKNIQDRFQANKTVGRHTYGDERIILREPGANLKIGSFCSIGKDIEIILGSYHRIDWITTFPFGQNETETFTKLNHLNCEEHPVTVTKGNIVIGNDVWLGNDVSIMSGVTIGDGATIGAYSVVAKDVPPYSIVVGNPGKVIRKKFNDEDIEFLLDLKWWDLENDIINNILPILCSGNIEELKNYFEINDRVYIQNQNNKFENLNYL